jgi:two-component system phosphate regulon sensor histidine kinase PhoR
MVLPWPERSSRPRALLNRRRRWPTPGCSIFADALPDPLPSILERCSVVVTSTQRARRAVSGHRRGRPIAFTLRAPALLSAIEAVRANGEPRNGRTAPDGAHRDLAPRHRRPARGGRGRWRAPGHHAAEPHRREAARALRTDFIANASHELRTPLTSLVGFIDTLLGPAANDREARERFLGIMRNQAVRMSS